MKAGISTASFCKFKETEDALSALNEAGAEVGEAYLRTFYEYRPEFAGKYAKNAKGTAICCINANSLNFEPQLFSPSRRISGDGFYWLDQVMRSAQLFGAKDYAFHGARECGGESEKFDYIADRLRAACDFCAGYGVKLCLENSLGGTYYKAGIFGELKSRCPSLCGALDLEKARQSGYPYSMYLRDMQGAISYVRISDVDADGKTCLPGCGVYDFKEIFMRLKDAGFDGNVYIETANFKDISELKQSLEYINEIIYNM